MQMIKAYPKIRHAKQPAVRFELRESWKIAKISHARKRHSEVTLILSFQFKISQSLGTKQEGSLEEKEEKEKRN